MVDHPGPRKVHVKPIPLLGGIAIYFGFVLAVLLTLHAAAQQQILGILAGATLLAIVGFLDDGGLLHHQVKLFIGMPVAALFLIASGIRAQLFSQFLPGTAGTVLDVCFTIFWVMGITAAFSILDHMDGLCAGIAAVAAMFFTISAGLSGQTMVRTLGAATLGAALGFLRWNFNPAKIFMGDGGAMFLGFLMATLGLKVRPEGAQFPASWIVPILILGVPIFDTTMVSISRARRGLLPFTSPGKDHTAHRLSNLGLGPRGAVLVLYFMAASLGALAVLVPQLSTGSAYALLAILAVCALIAIFLLEGAPYERQAKLQKSSSPS
jgi:UDP-GlcNAc:undecaprenyl-phosphate GlcNAc-1-phosphate transferase